MKFDDLYYIANELNKEKVRWMIGSSVLLYFHGIVDSPNDIDIVIDEKDIMKVKDIFDKIGIEQRKEKKYPYLTEYFYTYIVRDTSVDIMCNFGLAHQCGDYRLKIDEAAIVEYRKINDYILPLSSLEDWYVLYQLMSGRESKVNMIEEYLISNGVNHYELFDRALTQPLPEAVVCNIKSLTGDKA
ncbi:nucleotidyltransferase [Clostridium sp. YIM B02505]|uniref:Nucleotidyltransferase n=1 Tax=Clostridium yunnanense TaxID=2800325 RepID=A0ABS1ETB4_9CLOT|nr:nucleotidyltransferase [Clostridium yunnanense]MBK1812634.1 nucleotidyltransferase [Clostridium yunnanense]